MHRFSRIRTLLSIVVGAALLLTLVITPSFAQDEVVMTFGLSFTVDTLDPGATTFSGVEIIDGHVFDTLVKQQPLGTFHPALATDWTVNEDATEYTFNLRDDVMFHDGTPFNAEAVKYTFDRIVDPDTNSQMAFSFIGPYMESEVVDEYTVTVRFSSPNAAFLDGLSHPQLGPVSQAAVEELVKTGVSPVSLVQDLSSLNPTHLIAKLYWSRILIMPGVQKKSSV